MRFDLPESITAMREGRKTQTRRRSSYWLQKKPGSRITIVHQGQYLGHATIVGAWVERLKDADYEAEGYPTWQHFWHAWWSMYPDAEDLDGVTAIEFKDVTWT